LLSKISQILSNKLTLVKHIFCSTLIS